MKFDKETLIVVLIAGALLLVWFFFFPKWQAEKIRERDKLAFEAAAAAEKQKILDQESELLREKQRALNSPASGKAEGDLSSSATGSSGPVAPGASVSGAAAQEASLPGQADAEAMIAGKEEIIANELAEAVVNTATGAVERITLKCFRTADGAEDVVIGAKSPEKTFQMNSLAGCRLLSSSSRKEGESKLLLTRKFIRTEEGRSSSFTVKQIYEFRPDTYQIQYTLTLVNPEKLPLHFPELAVWASGVPTLKHLAGDKVYTERHNVDYCLAAGHSVVSADPSMSDEKYARTGTDQPVVWVGSTNKYFASLLFAADPFSGGAELTRTYYPDSSGKGNYSYPAIAGVYRDVLVPENAKREFEFTYYCGPKEINLIRELPESAMEVMHLSYFSWMDFLARPLLRLLNYLKELSGSYGWAIILLTIMVRVVFWPVTQKANNSMRKMQKLQPKVAELRTKYKDNPQEMNMKMMELYKAEKVNPLGGCQPILLQLPVFFALYSALDAAVELRQTSFWWIADLSKPDLVGPTIGLPFLGQVGLHPLVLMMTGLMVLQQKMTPSMADPAQQKIMMMMPVIMLVMLYNLPAGLTLYWTVSQVFSILQMKYSQYVAKLEEAKEQGSSGKNQKKKTA